MAPRQIWWQQCGEHAIALMVGDQEISRFIPARYEFVDQLLVLFLDNLDMDYVYVRTIRP